MTAPGYPKFSTKKLPFGGFDTWCRGCQVRGVAVDEAMLLVLERKHEKCPEWPRQEQR
jgi:hypothetical protein